MGANACKEMNSGSYGVYFGVALVLDGGSIKTSKCDRDLDLENEVKVRRLENFNLIIIIIINTFVKRRNAVVCNSQRRIK